MKNSSTSHSLRMRTYISFTKTVVKMLNIKPNSLTFFDNFIRQWKFQNLSKSDRDHASEGPASHREAC